MRVYAEGDNYALWSRVRRGGSVALTVTMTPQRTCSFQTRGMTCNHLATVPRVTPALIRLYGP